MNGPRNKKFDVRDLCLCMHFGFGFSIYIYIFITIFAKTNIHNRISLAHSNSINIHIKKKYGHEIDILIQYYERELLKFQSAIGITLVYCKKKRKNKGKLVLPTYKMEGFMANFFNTLCFVCSLDYYYGISNMGVLGGNSCKLQIFLHLTLCHSYFSPLLRPAAYNLTVIQYEKKVLQTHTHTL